MYYLFSIYYKPEKGLHTQFKVVKFTHTNSSNSVEPVTIVIKHL